MDKVINTSELRNSLPEIIRRVRRGDRFTVVYRSRPAFRLVPVGDPASPPDLELSDDPLYRAKALGRSTDGLTSRDHDTILYGRSRK